MFIAQYDNRLFSLFIVLMFSGCLVHLFLLMIPDYLFYLLLLMFPRFLCIFLLPMFSGYLVYLLLNTLWFLVDLLLNTFRLFNVFIAQYVPVI